MLASLDHGLKNAPAADGHPGEGLLADEDAIIPLQRWQAEGQRVVLVTLVGVEGGAPRQPGSQMAVAEDGRYAGYLSGGCLEKAVVVEALAALAERKNRLVRYGKGSSYFDVKLPCDSGLDLYFDQSLEASTVNRMMRLHTERRPFALATSMKTEVSTISELPFGSAIEECHRNGEEFVRSYPPRLRMFLLGQGPAVVGLARAASSAGMELSIVTHDDDAKDALDLAGLGRCVNNGNLADATKRIDLASVVVLCFHDHDNEPDILAQVIDTPAFYIGAVGSRTVHSRRLQVLASRGYSPEQLARIRGPIGSIAAAKSTATLSIGVLADVLAEAKNRNLVF